MAKWQIDDSAELYNIRGWGANYFSINDKGNVCVSTGKHNAKIELKEIIDELQIKDVSTPVLLRFSDILADRIEVFHKCFQRAAEEYDYKASNYIIYPIKVNQNRPVLEEIVKHGKQYNIGLEAGSKPELHAILPKTDKPDSLIICNGYKDEDYIELALLALKMGKPIYIVVEKLRELRLIINLSKQLKVDPNIGIRIKLASSGSGKWEASGGDRSKFGLSSGELLEAISMLEEENMLDRFKLIHFHIGSQVTKIRTIKNAIREASHFYVQLRKMGAEIEFVDIGGGLGVDYDGTNTSNQSSVNYTIQEYVNDAVFTMVDASDKHGVPHPNLITESGRSLTAHHSVLIFDVLEQTSVPGWDGDYTVSEEDHELVQQLYDLYVKLNPSNMLESWHDAIQIREEALNLFSLGLFNLTGRALIDRLYWSTAKEVYRMSRELKHPPQELGMLSKQLADKYFCNFSLFQSLPDAWAIDQVFPIIPIHRLDEKPEKSASLQDITCDSDGKIENFIGYGDYAYSLPVHSLNEDDPYYIGVFLVGAYQEILGDLHNLFGDTNAVHISFTKDGSYEIKQIIDAETVSEVLSYVQYDSKKLVRAMEAWVTRSVKDGKISAMEGKEFLSIYRSGLYGTTYLER